MITPGQVKCASGMVKAAGMFNRRLAIGLLRGCRRVAEPVGIIAPVTKQLPARRESSDPALGAAKNASTLHVDRLSTHHESYFRRPLEINALTCSSCVFKH
jgi:hypothetical protein